MHSTVLNLGYIKVHWSIGNGFKSTPATLSLYSEMFTFLMCTKLMLSVDWKIYMALYLQVCMVFTLLSC